MAKGVHSKRRKKNKSLQRKVIWETQGRKEHEEIHKRLMKRTYGAGDDEYIKRKKNAFRFPNDPTAIIPKQHAPVYIDKRSGYIPIEIKSNTKGITKAYKLEEQRQKKEIEDALKRAEEKVNGETRGNIDLTEMSKFNEMDLDKELSKLNNLNLLSKQERKKKKKSELKKEKESQSIDEDKEEKKGRIVRTSNKKKKKSKSHYIVNH